MSTGTNAGGISVGVELEEGGLDASLARIRQSLTVVGEQIRALNVQFSGGGMSVETYTKKMDELHQRNDILKRSSKDLETQVRATNSALAAGGVSQLAVGIGGASEAMGKAGFNAAFLTRGIVDMSRGFEDFTTGGFLGILNNIPGIVMNMSMAFGVAFEKAMAFGTAASIVATAGFALYKNWGLVQSVLGTGLDIPALKGLEALDDRLKTLNKRIEELRGKGKLSLPELFELKGAEEERARVRKQSQDEKDFQGLTNAPRPEDQARGKAFADAVAQSGGKLALEELQEALSRQADEKGRVGVLGAEVGTAAQVARELFINASRGEQTAINTVMGALPGASGFREAIRSTTPEAKAWAEGEDKRETEGAKRAADAAERLDKRIKTEADAFKKANDERLQNKLDSGQTLSPDELASAPRNLAERSVGMKLERGETLTQREQEGLTAKMRDNAEDKARTRAEREAGLNERASDLNERRMQLLNPQRENQRMGLDQFEASVHGKTGMTEEAKLLKELKDIQKEHLKIAREKQKLGGVARK